MENIGTKIKVARLERGLTQADVARQVRCSRNHVSSIERGVHMPSLMLWLKLKVVFGWSKLIDDV